MKISCLLLVALLMGTLLCACTQTRVPQMQDGYYTAEAASFDAHGWREFITIYVSNNRIVTVEFNAQNASGFIKSWDMDYMRDMNVKVGTYPNQYARAYAAELINKQKPAGIDAISSATNSFTSFQLLAEAAIAQAKKGDTDVVFVELSTVE